MQIKMYTKDYCSFCYAAKNLLAMGLDESITPGFTFLRNKINEKRDS